MSQPIRFVLALHNHQPVGNFDGVIEQAYQESYRPFLDVLDRYPELTISLHTSGCLLEWLDAHHPEYVDRLADMVAAGRLEVLGGAFFEPILTMLPPRDRVGQIRRYSDWLTRRLGATIRGMWVPERVWEQSLVGDLATAGIEFTVLDDFHFKNAGLEADALHGYFVSEDDGHLIKIFPGSERLRYTIPFQDPQATIDYLAEVAQRHPGAVAVFADDGEKFGTWPETHRHVYDDGWLDRFLRLVCEQRSWLRTTTFGEVIDHVPPLGSIYLPDASYREMTEWVLPAAQLVRYEEVVHEMEDDPRWPHLRPFIRGGFWRNYKVKYPEANEMYARMLGISRRLAVLPNSNGESLLAEQARDQLYRGQCNCSYWHGAFGGIYLPHLRNAVYRHLIAADTLLERASGRQGPWVEVKADDFNFDARQEVQLANDRLVALVAPAAGGMIYELDVRSIAHNLLATMARRPEAYHRKVLAGANAAGEHVASIHDRVVFKQADLDQRLVYDVYPRKSLLDHFYDDDVALEDVAACRAEERGDFAGGVYEARLRRSPDRAQVQLSRAGNAWGLPLEITKSITLSAGSSTLEVSYELSQLPADRPLHFGIEWNFAGLPAGADDRYFFDLSQRRLGQLGTRLDLDAAQGLGLADEWLGIALGITFSRPSGVWTFPVETVSQSEGGFELVHQSVVVEPHWLVTPDADGRWSVTIQLAIDTRPAESRSTSGPHAFATQRV